MIRFCRGCELPCTAKEFSFCASYIAIDWDQTALHLRYLSNQEKAFVEDPSVEASLKVRNYVCLICPYFLAIPANLGHYFSKRVLLFWSHLKKAFVENMEASKLKYKFLQLNTKGSYFFTSLTKIA